VIDPMARRQGLEIPEIRERGPGTGEGVIGLFLSWGRLARAWKSTDIREISVT
jgi:hypothetical protein